MDGFDYINRGLFESFQSDFEQDPEREKRFRVKMIAFQKRVVVFLAVWLVLNSAQASPVEPNGELEIF